MNKVHFKDPLCYLCLPGKFLVASPFVTQEAKGSNTAFFAKIFFKFYRFCRFYRIHLGKTLLAFHPHVYHISFNKQVPLVYGCNFDTIFDGDRKQFLWIKIYDNNRTIFSP